jgi:hypothetical protein
VFNQRSNTEEGLTEVLAWIDQAKRLGNEPYVAFATLAAARCEQALGNPSKQALHLINAGALPTVYQTHTPCPHSVLVPVCTGHIFFDMQSELEDTKSLNFEETIAHAIDCYLAAIKVCLYFIYLFIKNLINIR